MAFKFINPGYGSLFYPGAITVKSDVYNPRCGVAFYSYANYTNVYTTNNTSILYIKFDFYATRKDESSVKNRLYLQNKEFLRIERNSSNFAIVLLNDKTGMGVFSGFSSHLKENAVNTVWICLKTDNEWKISCNVNGTDIAFDYTSSNYSGSTIEDGTAIDFEVSEEMPISNLIISDEEIDLKEIIVPVNISEVYTTMTENNGSYSSASVNDYVLQKLDTNILYSTFGRDGKVTGLLAVAAPAYTTGEDVVRLDCRVVKTEFVGTDTVETATDYRPYNQQEDTITLKELTDDEIADLDNDVPSTPYQLNISTDTTLESINGLKVGWVTKGWYD